MRLSAPKQGIFLLSVILAVLGVVGTFVSIPFVSMYAFWVVVAGFVLLAAGTAMKGM